MDIRSENGELRKLVSHMYNDAIQEQEQLNNEKDSIRERERNLEDLFLEIEMLKRVIA